MKTNNNNNNNGPLELADQLGSIRATLQQAREFIAIWQEFIQEELLDQEESPEAYTCFSRRAKARTGLTEQAYKNIIEVERLLKGIEPGGKNHAS